jgi:hypothetical protein
MKDQNGTDAMDRDLQRQIMTVLADAFPDQIDLHDAFPGTAARTILREATYLRSQDLITWQDSEVIGFPNRAELVSITARGLDYLQPDGGLGRELETVTIRFEDSVIRDLLLRLVDDAPAEASVKSDLRRAILALPAEGLKMLALKAMQASLSRLPDAASLLGKWLGFH